MPSTITPTLRFRCFSVMSRRIRRVCIAIRGICITIRGICIITVRLGVAVGLIYCGVRICLSYQSLLDDAVGNTCYSLRHLKCSRHMGAKKSSLLLRYWKACTLHSPRGYHTIPHHGRVFHHTPCRNRKRAGKEKGELFILCVSFFFFK